MFLEVHGAADGSLHVASARCALFRVINTRRRSALGGWQPTAHQAMRQRRAALIYIVRERLTPVLSRCGLATVTPCAGRRPILARITFEQRGKK